LSCDPLPNDGIVVWLEEALFVEEEPEPVGVVDVMVEFPELKLVVPEDLLEEPVVVLAVEVVVEPLVEEVAVFELVPVVADEDEEVAEVDAEVVGESMVNSLLKFTMLLLASSRISKA